MECVSVEQRQCLSTKKSCANRLGKGRPFEKKIQGTISAFPLNFFFFFFNVNKYGIDEDCPIQSNPPANTLNSKFPSGVVTVKCVPI